jgi:hypothetical protein
MKNSDVRIGFSVLRSIFPPRVSLVWSKHWVWRVTHMVHVCTEAGEDTSIEEDILNCSFMVAMLPLAGTVPTPHDVLNSPTYQGAKDKRKSHVAMLTSHAMMRHVSKIPRALHLPCDVVRFCVLPPISKTLQEWSYMPRAYCRRRTGHCPRRTIRRRQPSA